ncbi:MAG: glycosyltransferase family protein, partial [Myxococcota bacterium]
MRILYGVHGYSRGHATRAAAVLSELVKEHEVLIFAGADAYDLLKSDFVLFHQLRENSGRPSGVAATITVN